jgi:hypothetical protein
MKKAFLPLMLVIASVVSQAQPIKLPKALIAVHGFYAAPQGSFKNSHNYGYGADAQLGIGFGSTMLTGTVGYGNFNGKSGYKDIKYIPINLGIRKYLIAGLFLNANAGVAMTSVSGGDKTTNFMAEGGAGFKILGLELLANYSGWDNKGGSGWSAGWVFKAGFAVKL